MLTQKRNLIIFILLALGTVILSSYFYIKKNRDPLSIEIQNGCGEPGLAAQIAQKLYKWDVFAVGNADRYDFEKTVIIARCKKNNRELKRFCAEIGYDPQKVIYHKQENHHIVVTLILGKDYRNYFPQGTSETP
ncbi:MAG TPA: LytR C-terminal domain-containing protein [bacterium]|nr:LytR C-terminal domain-containing protein [bacterium]HPN42742.1 LytR C-terminal domain-containing protein [bacterium]